MYIKNGKPDAFNLIIEDVAKELNLPLDIVKEVCNSQIDFIKSTINRGDLDTVKIPYIGNFFVNPIVYYLNKLRNMGVDDPQGEVHKIMQLKKSYGSLKKQRELVNNLIKNKLEENDSI